MVELVLIYCSDDEMICSRCCGKLAGVRKLEANAQQHTQTGRDRQDEHDIQENNQKNTGLGKEEAKLHS